MKLFEVRKFVVGYPKSFGGWEDAITRSDTKRMQLNLIRNSIVSQSFTKAHSSKKKSTID